MTVVASRTELRVYLPIASLQRQFAAYLGTPTRARAYPPAEGDSALIVEVAPGLAIERVTDLALPAEPWVEPGILLEACNDVGLAAVGDIARPAATPDSRLVEEARHSLLDLISSEARPMSSQHWAVAPVQIRSGLLVK